MMLRRTHKPGVDEETSPQIRAWLQSAAHACMAFLYLVLLGKARSAPAAPMVPPRVFCPCQISGSDSSLQAKYAALPLPKPAPAYRGNGHCVGTWTIHIM